MISKPVDLPADLASAYLAPLSEREMLRLNVRSLLPSVIPSSPNGTLRWRKPPMRRLSDSEALIASLELAIEKLKRELRGRRSGARRA